MGDAIVIQTAAAPVKTAWRSYLVEFSFTMGLYVLAVLARPWLLNHAGNGPLALLIKIMPALPIWLTFAVVWRYYLRIDEFDRLKFLQTLAISFGIGSCAVVTYSFLADAGLPPLAITWAWPTLATSWGLTTAIVRIANK
jgi:hypothetical protein